MDLPDLTNLGPIAPGSLLVLRHDVDDIEQDFAAQVAEEVARVCGHHQHLVLVLAEDAPPFAVEILDPDMVEQLRAELDRLPRPTPKDPTS